MGKKVFKVPLKHCGLPSVLCVSSKMQQSLLEEKVVARPVIWSCCLHISVFLYIVSSLAAVEVAGRVQISCLRGYWIVYMQVSEWLRIFCYCVKCRKITGKLFFNCFMGWTARTTITAFM